MKKFELATDAVREIKKIIERDGMDIHLDEIFLVHNKYREIFYVTTDEDEISDKINEIWCDGGCDSAPESEADSYTIWKYVNAENKEKYPSTYKRYKRSLIKTDESIIRMKMGIECDYSVRFFVT